MKMNKSIKDYKDAINSIRISESFYKRTEALLNDLPDDENDKKHFYIGKKITAAVMAAAACIVCIIGIRIVLEERENNISSEQDTSITRITTQVTTDISAPKLIDIPEGIDEELGKAAAAGALPEYETAAEPALTEDTGYDAAADSEDRVQLTETTAVQAQSSAPDESQPPETTLPQGTAVFIANPYPVCSVPPQKDGSAEDTGTEEASTQEETAAANEDAEVYAIPDISDIMPENITVRITTHFSMEDVRSDEVSAIKETDGEEFSEILDKIKSAAETPAEVTGSGADPVAPIFAVDIFDKTSGNALYSISINDNKTLVIIRSDPAHEKIVCTLSDSSYIELKRSLFLLFGTEEELQEFESMTAP